MKLRGLRLKPIPAILGAAVFAGLAVLARADNWAPNLTGTAGWNSNVTRADASQDQIDSLQITADILASQRYDYGSRNSLHLRGHLAADWWPRYDALLTGAIGARAEWQHKLGVTTRSPTLGIEASGDEVSTREPARRGTRTGITASVRQRLNDLTRATLAHEVSTFNARRRAFDSASSETTFTLERDLNNVSRLTFNARFRDGDVVTYASGSRPDLAALAPHRLDVTTFRRAMTAYRVDAQTWSGRLAFVRALDESSAMVIAYEARHTQRSSLRFREHLFSVGIVQQF